MNEKSIEAISKWSTRRKNQYNGLFDVSMEVGDEEQAAYAVSQLMAYKIPLTEQQRSLIDRVNIYCGDRDVRSEDYDKCSTKWLFGSYESTLDFFVTGTKDGQTVEVGVDDQGNKEYDTIEEQYTGVLTEITSKEEIAKLGTELKRIASANNRVTMSYTPDMIEELTNGLGFIYKISLIGDTTETLGYTIVLGIPGKKAYVYLNFIDYKACEALDIDGEKFKQNIANTVKLSLETHNKEYETRDKSVDTPQ